MSALALGAKSNSQSGSPTVQETKPRKEMIRRCTAIVAATAGKLGIGMNGTLPWKLPGDMKFFRKTTSTVENANHYNAVVMGRKTWESIPKKFRPLSGRVNVVLTKDDEAREKYDIPSEVLVAKSLEKGLSEVNAIRNKTPIETVFVIGGGKVYEEAMNKGLCEQIYLTRIHNDEIECDTFFPEVSEERFHLVSNGPMKTENGIKYEFLKYQEKEHEELQYLNLIKDILANGNHRMDRTGTGTISKFGVTQRYSLRNNTMPLLTTKRTFWRGVAEELLWFVSGSTNAKLLQDKNIHIWDGNGSREFLDSRGLTENEEMDLGPVYGFQWRHFGAEYKTMHDDYKGQGVDQIATLVKTIKTNPTDRRMIVSAWNPAAFHLMALPPCHMFAQFYVANGELSCQMYQRSADMGLGVPFNIASYALLTHMVAHVTGLKAGEFVHVIGDAHVYKNHVEPLKPQLDRVPRPFPKLRFKRTITDIDDFKYEDFELIGYKPHKSIKMKMAV
jgi:dihydrofolate reductase / thymidylate synthase